MPKLKIRKIDIMLYTYNMLLLFIILLLLRIMILYYPCFSSFFKTLILRVCYALTLLSFSLCSLSSLLTPFTAEVVFSSWSSFLATSSVLVFSSLLTSRGPSLTSRSLTILLKDLTSLASANLLLDDVYNVKSKSLNIDNTNKIYFPPPK